MQTNIVKHRTKKPLLNRELGERTALVVDELRQRIASGQYLPEAPLPTWQALRDEFGVTRSTLTRAVGVLKRDGFIISRSTQGTYVAAYPPHTARIAIAFYSRPGARGWNRFWNLLTHEAATLSNPPRREIVPFFEVNDLLNNPAHQQLLADARAHRLAGLILCGDPHMVGAELREFSHLPVVGIWSSTDGDWGKIPSVYVDLDSFVDRSLDALMARGCRRIATVATQWGRFPQYPAAMAARGLESRSWWHLTASVEFPDTVRPIIEVLLRHPLGDRPDGLVIADDNLVDDALAAVQACGLRVPEDIEIVAHCGLPRLSGSAPLPVMRLGFDCREVLSSALRLIEDLRADRPVERRVRLAAVFEDERTPTPLATSFLPHLSSGGRGGVSDFSLLDDPAGKL